MDFKKIKLNILNNFNRADIQLTLIFLAIYLPFFSYAHSRPTVIHFYLGQNLADYFILPVIALFLSSLILYLSEKPSRLGINLILSIILLTTLLKYSIYVPAGITAIMILAFFKPYPKKLVLTANILIITMLFAISMINTFGFSKNQEFIPNGQIGKFNTIFLILDEFSLEQIGGYNTLNNKKDFPNFSKLLSTSDVYYNAISNNTQTQKAVPSILTGQYVNSLGNGFYSQTPLIYELKPYIENIHLHEIITSFDNFEHGNALRRNYKLLKHLCKSLKLDTVTDIASISKHPESWDHKRANISLNEDIIASDEQFVFVQHLLFPHGPYIYNGEDFYNHKEQADSYIRSPDNLNNSSLSNMYNYRNRYLDQLKKLDFELGKLFNLLEKNKKFDNTLILLTADHGISFSPNLNGRSISKENYNSIAYVPTFIKYPFQKAKRDIFKPISNSSLIKIVLKEYGLTEKFAPPLTPTTYQICFEYFTCSFPLTEPSSNINDYHFKLESNEKIFSSYKNYLTKYDDFRRSNKVDKENYLELEMGADNLERMNNVPYYPYNFIVKTHFRKQIKSIVATVDGIPCAEIEIPTKDYEDGNLYSIYCKLTKPSKPSHVDFYSVNQDQLQLIPKLMGYSFFSSSPWSGNWIKVLIKKHQSNKYSKAIFEVYHSVNHAELIFVDKSTSQIMARYKLPERYPILRVNLYKNYFTVEPSDNTLNYINFSYL